MARDLKPLFEPASIAIVGASNEITKLRGRIPMQLIKGGFKGQLWPVHPRETEIQGLKVYASLKDLPGKPDLALIVIPSDKVLQALEEAADAGARAAIVYTAGFAEEGEHNRALQDQLAATARARGIAMVGPNSVGALSAASAMVASFSPSVDFANFERARSTASQGRVAIVSQSGGLAFALSGRGARRGLLFSAIVSTGNEADIDCVDVLDYLIDDDNTSIVMMFLETIRRGRAFMEAASRAIEKGKTIIVTKVGRSAAGARAAASHTASLTGADAVFDAVFRHYGVIRVDDLEEMIDVACAFAFCPPAKGRRVGVVTVSGGVGGWLSDALVAQGLSVPEFSPALQGTIREFLPSYGSAFNPVDVSAMSLETDHRIRSMEVVAQSPEVDAIVNVVALSSDTWMAKETARIAAVTAKRERPVMFYSYPIPKEGSIEAMAQAGCPVYSEVKGCARALRALVDYGAIKAAPPRVPAPASPAKIPAELLLQGVSLTEFEAKALLTPFGIQGPRHMLARTPDDAVAAARKLGYPVALKIQSRAIPHKTEVGGVVLKLADDKAVRAEFAHIMEGARYAAPFADIAGILVQRMAAPGLEAIVGVTNDPVFGPIITVGLGGIHAEILKDTQSAPAPIDETQALALLRQLKAWPLFEGVRGAKPADAAALAKVVAGLSRFAHEYAGQIADIDLNPVLVHEDGRGVSVVDALIVTGDAAQQTQIKNA